MFVAKPRQERGFRFWRRGVGQAGRAAWLQYRARYDYLSSRRDAELNDLGIADIISVPRVRGGYPAEKPAEVAAVLIGQSSQPGETVADPFMGSGSVGVAAARLGRRFLGNDLNPEAVQIAAARLGEFGPGLVPPGVSTDRQPGQPDLLASVATRR